MTECDPVAHITSIKKNHEEKARLLACSFKYVGHIEASVLHLEFHNQLIVPYIECKSNSNNTLLDLALHT